MDVIKKIKSQIKKNLVLLYMKGTPTKPSCGFSSKAAEILSKCKKDFFYVDVLENSDIRIALPKFSNWPTFPQLWINGNLIGGCSIIIKMFENGKLQELIDNIKK
ncbi:Grx4 family monothiol glutaredoxin [Buchnera aphidicola (Mindarus keteleerifoliae)]|uniref:Grx4 family monothiol glutaredoxin n=1 Tax=Buchnera aphidicola TaxID=9 RepID=UPI0031B6766E